MLVITPGMMEGIPLLRSLFNFSDPQEPPIFELPPAREFKKDGLQLPQSLVIFCMDEPNYQIPKPHQEMLGLVRLADFVGVDFILEKAAKWLDVSVDAIANHNPVQNVHQLIRGRYQASQYNNERALSLGVCVYCMCPIKNEVIVPCRPRTIELPKSSCCNAMVYPQCRQRHPTCSACHKLLRVLLCVVCKQPIAWGEEYASEYAAALPHRTPCCGADCHSHCKSDTIYRCPLCSYPLDNWKVDTELELAGDVLAARRMSYLNDIRRRENLP